MTRSSSGPRLDFDPQIESTLLAIRKSHRISEKNTIPTKQMANPNNKTFKELAAPDVTYQPLCIEILRLMEPLN